MMKDEKREVQQVCPYCNQIKTVYLTEEEFENWLRYLDGGLLIQDMLPNVSNADRELLRGGMCGEC